MHPTQPSDTLSQTQTHTGKYEDDEEDIEVFDFEKWIQEHHLEEIKAVLIDYDMVTLDSLDLYGRNALTMMQDERITNKPHLLPTLMSSIISLKQLKIVIQRKTSTQSQSRDDKSSNENTPISALSSFGARSSRGPSSSPNLETPIYGVPILEELPSWEAWDPGVETIRSSPEDQKRRAKVQFDSTVQLHESRRKSERQNRMPQELSLHGLNIALRGLNIRDCKRSNFHMNSIDAYPQSMIHSLDTKTSTENASSLKAWVLNICFHAFLLLYIYFTAAAIPLAWVWLVCVILSWMAYTYDWVVQMIRNPWRDINKEVSVYDAETICRTIRRFVELKPIIKWDVKCYHIKIDNHKETEVATGIRRPEVRSETLRKDGVYSYTNWKDISPDFVESYLKRCPFTELTIYKSFQFADKKTEEDYYHRAELFRQEHDNDDNHQYFGHWVELSHWMGDKHRASHIMVRREKEHKDAWCISKWYFGVFSCCMFGACYRAYASRKIETQKMDYIVLKEISL